MTQPKRLGTAKAVMQAQVLASLEKGSAEHSQIRSDIQALAHPKDYTLILSIEANHRRRAAGIIDGKITDSHTSTYGAAGKGIIR